MKKNNILTKLGAILIIILILSLVIAFVSCSDDIVGPQIRDKDENKDKKEDGTGDDPSDGGGTIALNNPLLRFAFADDC